MIFVIPNEKDQQKVKEICGRDLRIVFITISGQVCFASGLISSNFETLFFVRKCSIRNSLPILDLWNSKSELPKFTKHFYFCKFGKKHHRFTLLGWVEQLGALISASSRVVTTNTVALQLAIALKIPM